MEQRLEEKAVNLGEYLVSKPRRIERLGIVREIRGRGVLRSVEMVADSNTKKPFPADRKLGEALKKRRR